MTNIKASCLSIALCIVPAVAQVASNEGEGFSAMTNIDTSLRLEHDENKVLKENAFRLKKPVAKKTARRLKKTKKSSKKKHASNKQQQPHHTALSGTVTLKGQVTFNDELEVKEDAIVSYQNGTVITCNGRVLWNGALLPWGVPVDESKQELIVSGADQPPTPSLCSGYTKKKGGNGLDGASISFKFFSDATFGPHAFDPICNDRPVHRDGMWMHIKAEKQSMLCAIGGHGGRGGNTNIWMSDGNTLTFQGTKLCNQRGGNGGATSVVGATPDDSNCTRGGDGMSLGGNGGGAGNLVVQAPNVVFADSSHIRINSGGNGGDAVARGGRGSRRCHLLCRDGGRGGHATSRGGASKSGGTIRIEAGNITPDPNDILDEVEADEPSLAGNAWAYGGDGGAGGDCACGKGDGGTGGKGGNGVAKGGDGAKGQELIIEVGGGIFALNRRGFSGSDGGFAVADGGEGGFGGGADRCHCSVCCRTGSGGNGGPGGRAESEGGQGGSAKWTHSGISVVAGNGGNSWANCGNGGSGTCLTRCSGLSSNSSYPRLRCSSGAAGFGGLKGEDPVAKGGGGGKGFGGALDGQTGDEYTTDCYDAYNKNRCWMMPLHPSIKYCSPSD